jgi:D-proline reductase (dithiol) PrdB
MPFSYVEMMRGFGLAEYAELPSFDPVAPAPFDIPPDEARVGLFTSCGAHLPTARPFSEINDLTFRLLSRDVPVSDVTFGHPSPIRGFAEQDLNVAYPRDRLIELEAEGVIGELAPNAASMLGSITKYTDLLERTLPTLAETFKDQDVDLVLMVPFCPACHRATSLLARGLESNGVPCVMLTVLREMAESFKPARPVFLDFPLGATVGRPNDPGLQREILRATLRAATELGRGLWRIHDLPFSWDERGDRSWEDDVRRIYAETGKSTHRARVAEHASEGERLAGREDELNIACAC